MAARLLAAAGAPAGSVTLGNMAVALEAGAEPAALVARFGLSPRAAEAAAAQALSPTAAAAQLLPPSGLWVSDPLARLIARLYATALHRLPEPGGLAFWKEVGDPVVIARGILASAEHAARRSHADTDAVALFYPGALARPPEPEGHAVWQTGMAEDPAVVLIGIADSAEAQQLAHRGGLAVDGEAEAGLSGRVAILYGCA